MVKTLPDAKDCKSTRVMLLQLQLLMLMLMTEGNNEFRRNMRSCKLSSLLLFPVAIARGVLVGGNRRKQL